MTISEIDKFLMQKNEYNETIKQLINKIDPIKMNEQSIINYIFKNKKGSYRTPFVVLSEKYGLRGKTEIKDLDNENILAMYYKIDKSNNFYFVEIPKWAISEDSRKKRF